MATKAIDASRTTSSGVRIKQRRIRKIFGNIHEISEMPNLIEVQRESYEQFLRSDPKSGYVSGLEKTLRSVFPIMDFAGTAPLDFDHYELEPPKYDTDECRQRGLTFAAHLVDLAIMQSRLSLNEISEDELCELSNAVSLSLVAGDRPDH